MALRWSGGHSAPVLCVDAARAPEGLLASGSEGGEVTTWTQDGTRLAQLRLSDGADVTCAAFSPVAPGLLYAAHGETVSVLDPRSMKAPVGELSGVGEDEINSLSFNETGAMLALADDAGAVRVVEVQSGKVCRTLRKHSNICSSVAFRPQRPQSLVSAGLDMQVMLWNLQKTRPLGIVSLQEVSVHEEPPLLKGGQMFNPPLAHCVSVASCGNALACAAEDGLVHLMHVGSGSRLHYQGALKGHTQGVSQAHFIHFLSHPYWLATGGNDGLVAIWDVGQLANPVEAKTRTAANHKKAKSRHKSKQHHDKPKAQPSTEGSEKDDDEEESGSADPDVVKDPGPRLSFNHQDKVNWVCPASLKGQPSLLVADQSCSLSVYSLSGL
ncbi:WD repeat-containing protein 53 [Denticeps clupeoides]|uniref:Anaphase-promoting complex subunit 4-like WD40 domain-containing protein n=1 Tax=Denticeps clupeoides TaxID=299321 RepID=A0AAY4A546_9TELE|nr:WD repeat-containing protein 53 [Denticeps clupeoides]